MSNRSACRGTAAMGVVALALGIAPEPAIADELQELQRQIEALESKVQALESRQEVHERPAGNAVTSGATKG